MNSGNGLDLFISISLTYPELNAVRYDADHNIISLEVAVQGEISAEEEKSFLHCINQSLDLYHRRKILSAEVSKVYVRRLDEICLLHFERDMGTMSEGEMELVINLIQDNYPNRIIFDRGESITEEPFKHRVKQNLLRSISKNEDKHHYLAFRKKGRVLVFQK
jgi:hypothetical protein